MTVMTGASASPGENPPVPPSDLSDYDYIIRVIQFLDERYGIRFFISTRDFDVLYHWWEKRIPIEIVEQSLAAVVDRFRKRESHSARWSPSPMRSGKTTAGS